MRGRTLVRGAAVAIVGVLAISALMVPASAHLNSPPTFGHLKRHFYTKGQSNARFINIGETATAAANATNADKLDGADSTAFQGRSMWAHVDENGAILEQSGGISLQRVVSPGFYYLHFPALVKGRAIVATAEFANADVFYVAVNHCGGTSTGVACGPGTNTSDVFAHVTNDAADSVDGAFYVVVLP